MNEDLIKSAYDSMTPDEAARQRMLKRIMKKGECDMKKEYSAQPHESKGWIGPVAAILVLACLIAGTVTMLNREDPAQLSDDQTSETTESTEIVQTGAIADFMESNFYKASVEWYDYYQAYIGQTEDIAPLYRSYWAQNTEMAEKLQQTVDFYGLTLESGLDVSTGTYEELLKALGLFAVLKEPEPVEAGVSTFWWNEDGKIIITGDICLTDGQVQWPYPIGFEYYRISSDILALNFKEVGHLENYDCWEYTVASGETVIMALGAEKAVIIFYNGQEVVYILVNQISAEDHTISREALEAFAELFSYEPVGRIELEDPDTEKESAPNVAAYPLPAPDDLANCTVPVSLQPGDIWQDDTGAAFMNVTIYTYDQYDMVDIAQLEVGEYIYIRGQAVEITSLERAENGDVLINGGVDKKGYTLHTDESTMYYEVDVSNQKCWQEYAQTTVPLSTDFRFCDVSGGCGLVYTLETFTEMEFEGEFTPYNTTIVIEDGIAITMERRDTP